MQSVFDFVVPTLDGGDYNMSELQGNTLLIVNTASKGDAKKKLKQLNHIQELFIDKNFKVICFPCNQFMHNERSTNEKIKDYYLGKKGYKFMVFSKVKLNHGNALPMYKWLQDKKGGDVNENFTKFLVSSDGVTVQRFGPLDSFEKIVMEINKELRK